MSRWYKTHWSIYLQIVLAVMLAAWFFTWLICIGSCRGEMLPCVWKILFTDFVEACR